MADTRMNAPIPSTTAPWKVVPSSALIFGVP
jgi:hypothetical protein